MLLLLLLLLPWRVLICFLLPFHRLWGDCKRSRDLCWMNFTLAWTNISILIVCFELFRVWYKRRVGEEEKEMKNHRFIPLRFVPRLSSIMFSPDSFSARSQNEKWPSTPTRNMQRERPIPSQLYPLLIHWQWHYLVSRSSRSLVSWWARREQRIE